MRITALRTAVANKKVMGYIFEKPGDVILLYTYSGVIHGTFLGVYLTLGGIPKTIYC